MQSHRQPLAWTSRFAQALAAGSLIFFLAHCIWVIAGPEHRIMDWLYDDAFYYLIVASHFSQSHLATFDGITRTSGYHPLWMWLCSVMYSLHGRLDLTYVRLCMGLSFAISGTLIATAVIAKIRSASFGWLCALAITATSYSALNNGITIMEWPLVLCFWTLLHLLIVSFADAESTRRHAKWVSISVPLAFVLGVLGSLSRTDFGLIPAAYLAGALVASRFYGRSRSVSLSAVAVAGSAAGVGITFVYNYATTGDWLQKSAQTKQLLASVSSGFNPLPAAWQFVRVLIYLPPLSPATADRVRMLSVSPALVIALCVVVGVVAVVLCARFAAALLTSPTDVLSMVAATVGLLAYGLFYSFNSQAAYGWYTATVTGFILILFARICEQIPRRLCAILIPAILVLNLALLEIGGPNAQDQYAEVVIGKEMQRSHPGAVMGGGDVGKPSFFNHGTMINTDGLMNNEVYPYMASGRFPCYILARHIEFLSDMGSIPIVLTDRIRARNHQTPIPWRLYFPEILVKMPDGSIASYNHTDFGAILGSGECNAFAGNPVR